MPGSVALIFGAFIVVFFAYDRFNRAGYEGSQQFERLVAYLSPDKLRARRVVLRAYLFYAATLLVIYLFLCIYAEVLPQLGATLPGSEAIGASGVGTQDPSGAVPPEGRAGARISSSVALGVALIMVGLAPSFPILESFEKWLRSTAHRLAGIPTRVLEVAENLRRNQFGFEDWDWAKVPSRTLLIPAGDWQRMADYDHAARTRLSAPDDFRDCLEVIFAASAWILDRKLKLADARDRLRFQSLEAALLERFEALRTALDEKAATSPPPSAESPASRRSDTAWERLAREADHLADDLCFLLALYLEHGIIVRGQSAAAGEETRPLQADPNGKVHVSQHQHRLARERLEAFLGIDGHQPSAPAPRSHMVVTWLWTLGVVMTVSLVWSQFPGAFEAEMQNGMHINGYQRLVGYTFNGFTTFCIPMIVALALRDGGLQSGYWVDMSSAHWTRALPQGLAVVVVSSVAATLMLIAAIMWELAIARKDSKVTTGWDWDTLGFQFAYVAPVTLRGAILALIMVVLLDAYLAGARSLSARRTWMSSLPWAILAAVTMALGGGLSRTMASSVALARNPARESLDAIDRGLIVYSALYSAIIGFFVVFCVAEYLLNQRLARGRAQDGANGRPRRPVAAE